MKVMVVFGTRPEAIKMAPVIKELQKRQEIETIVCVTAQHRQMLDQVLSIFDIKPHYDLNIFKEGQTLTEITINAIAGLEDILKLEKPDILLVQGDTNTVFAGALAAFYQGIRVGHVEAGLRSGNLYSPFPEEGNRKLTGVISNYHFAPTKTNRENLLEEGYPDKGIFITGNTGIDALKYVIDSNYKFEEEIINNLPKDKKLILLTSHRRENIGKPMENIFKAVKRAVDERDDCIVVFPIHLNPKVREIAEKVFGDDEKIIRIEPLDYAPFANLMAKAHFVVTDSGGLQEEAPALGKPVLVIREETERPEGIVAGTVKLVGTEFNAVYEGIYSLLNDQVLYNNMAKAANPYGDGTAAKKIVDILMTNAQVF